MQMEQMPFDKRDRIAFSVRKLSVVIERDSFCLDSEWCLSFSIRIKKNKWFYECIQISYYSRVVSEWCLVNELGGCRFGVWCFLKPKVR